MELVSSIQTCTLDGHLHRVTYTRYRINKIDSPDDEHRGAPNMWRIGINIEEKKIVPQVGYLQELHRDARSTEHEIQVSDVRTCSVVFASTLSLSS
jgi:hypothetical protein